MQEIVRSTSPSPRRPAPAGKPRGTAARILCLLWLLCLAAPGRAQVSPPVPKKTSDHNKQVIGYLTQWGPWKDIAGLIPKGSLSQLNVDYSQFTILNFSFFGVAVDGSIHSGDYRNPNIGQPGAVQQPAPLLNTDTYSSWDLYLLYGELDILYHVADNSYAYSLGYRNSGGGWSNVDTGESGAFPLAVPKQDGAKGLLDLAHANGVKVMASIGGWSMCKHYPEMAADPVKRQRFVDDCKKLIAKGFDGIDLDWEYPGSEGMNFTGTAADFTNFAVLIEEIPLLPYPLEITSLLLVQDSAINIRFRMDEKRFDVDGSYHARYEIIEKRIDKARIKDSAERITETGKITIVHSDDREAREYRQYTVLLQAQGRLEAEVEQFEVEALQGISGFKALRVKIIYDSTPRQ